MPDHGMMQTHVTDLDLAIGHPIGTMTVPHNIVMGHDGLRASLVQITQRSAQTETTSVTPYPETRREGLVLF